MRVSSFFFFPPFLSLFFAHWGFCLLLFTLSFFFFVSLHYLFVRVFLFFFFLYTLMVRDDVSFAEGLDNSCVCLYVGMSSLAAFLLPFLLRVCVTTMTNFFVRGEHVFFFFSMCVVAVVVVVSLLLYAFFAFQNALLFFFRSHSTRTARADGGEAE